ncbi:MAG: hypothetical protein C0490_15370 [Marivirga sp.]|nr:hypothetical protein [Marivirga sp.]
MKSKIVVLLIIVYAIVILNSLTTPEQVYHPEFEEAKTSGSIGVSTANAYPPAVGILSNSKNCVACHSSNGPWRDNDSTIIDIIDKTTGKSYKQPDGNFVIEAERNEVKTVLTVIGRAKGDLAESPYRNAWIYVDPTTIGTNSLSKFAPGWETNLQLSCRIVGDKIEFFEGAKVTSLPMTIRPTDAARNAELQLQVMLTKGESVKGNPKEGMKGNYFERKVKLIVKN